MIEILNTPLQPKKQFKELLDQRGVQNRTTWGISGSVFAKPSSLKRALGWRIKNSEKPVVIGGTGSYHHLTYGLCANLKQPFGYIHIDGHSDFGDKSLSYICMGGFVESLLANTKAEAGLLIGCDEMAKSLIGHDEMVKATIIPSTHLGELEERLDKDLTNFPRDVYVSVDLDVLDPSEFDSGYDTGKMKSEQLFKTLDSIAAQKKIIGGDIFGCLGNDKDSLDIALNCILKIHESA